jgi:hypothetical protein
MGRFSFGPTVSVHVISRLLTPIVWEVSQPSSAATDWYPAAASKRTPASRDRREPSTTSTRGCPSNYFESLAKLGLDRHPLPIKGDS